MNSGFSLPEENWKDRILYEDSVLLLANKPASIPVHETKDPNRPDMTRSLQNYLGLEYLRCVNRLDLQTTGIIVFCKDASFNHTVDELMKSSKKKYRLVVEGIPPWKTKRIESFLKDGNKRVQTVRSGGKKAITEFRVLLQLDAGKTLLEAELFTGRRHQIRIHISEAGYPIVGDEVYGKSSPSSRLYLHSYCLELSHTFVSQVQQVLVKKEDTILPSKFVCPPPWEPETYGSQSID